MQQKPTPHTLCYVAGRSGGHIVPALALAKEHKQQYPQDTILFFSTHKSLDSAIINNAQIVDTHYPLRLENFPGKRIWLYPYFIACFVLALLKNLVVLQRTKPKSVTTTGGYIAIPVCIAAWLLRIPIIVYELNVLPGKAATLIAKIATEIKVCFPSAQQHFAAAQCIQSPYPVRFTPQQKMITQQQARMYAQLNPERFTLFVLGGSQGSLFLNTLTKQIVEAHPALTHTIQIIHQTGARDATDWNSYYKKMNIPAIVFGYHDAVEYYYAAANLVVCRAGAGTLWELVFFNKKAVIVPIVAATTDHQIHNAQEIAKLYPQLFTVAEQDEALNKIKELLQERIFHEPYQAKNSCSIADNDTDRAGCTNQ